MSDYKITFNNTRIKVHAKKKRKKSKLSLINLKVTEAERRELSAFAKKYADGNLSAWLRHAGRKYRPKKTEVIR